MSLDTSTTTAIPTDLITARAGAKLLAIHPTTLYRIIREGGLRAWKRVGGHVRVSKADVLSLMVPVQVGKASERSEEDSQLEAEAAAAKERLERKWAAEKR